jgi:hypothetical protein
MRSNNTQVKRLLKLKLLQSIDSQLPIKKGESVCTLTSLFEWTLRV